MLEYLQEHYDLSRVQMIGASAGALVATLAICDVDLDLALQKANEMAQKEQIWDRPLGLAGVWGRLVRQWLDDLLPANAAANCRDRLKLVVTEVPSFKTAYTENYTSRDQLIDATMASAHIPFFLDGRAFCVYGGKKVIDGSFSDFLSKSNSELLLCDGDAFVVDYYDDTELQFGRFDFLKLRDYEEIVGLIEKGYKYAERAHQAGELDKTLGRVACHKI